MSEIFAGSIIRGLRFRCCSLFHVDDTCHRRLFGSEAQYEQLMKLHNSDGAFVIQRAERNENAP